MTDTDKTNELARLRDIMEINHAIRALDLQKKTAGKKYTQGIRQLEKELAVAESELMTGDSVMQGMSCIETRGDSIKALIADPCLRNIPVDANP